MQSMWCMCVNVLLPIGDHFWQKHRLVLMRQTVISDLLVMVRLGLGQGVRVRLDTANTSQCNVLTRKAVQTFACGWACMVGNVYM